MGDEEPRAGALHRVSGEDRPREEVCEQLEEDEGLVQLRALRRRLFGVADRAAVRKRGYLHSCDQHKGGE